MRPDFWDRYGELLRRVDALGPDELRRLVGAARAALDEPAYQPKIAWR